MKHTLTPWVLDCTHVYDKEDVCVESCDLEGDAAYIVKAVNARDALVAALQDFINGVETNAITSDHDETFANLLRRSRAALSLAREV